MFLPSCAGLWVRLRAVALGAGGLAIASAAIPTAASAHDGHDHGPPPPALPITTQPRAVATGDEFEAVAVLSGSDVLIFVDRFADNSPVTGAKVTVTVGAEGTVAPPATNGVYRLTLPALGVPGRHDLIISVEDGASNDLLVASLDTPQTAAVQLPSADGATVVDSSRRWLADWTSQDLPLLGAMAAMGLAASLVVRWLRPRVQVAQSRGAKPTSIVSAVLFAVSGSLALTLSDQPATAHEGHDHAPPSAAALATSGDAPRRLADGSVFVPKTTQRLLIVRTVLAAATAQRPSQTLVGRVIANPARSGLVQSSTGGRVMPPQVGLPRLGQAVKAGEILAFVTPAFQAIDSANVAQTAGDLDQQIELARAKLERAQRLLASNAGTRVLVDETDMQLKGLERRRVALSSSQVGSEPLVAPVSGVVSATRAVPGQVVAPQDVLFEIIDPTSLWVEALVFDQAPTQGSEPATASAQDGRTFALSFIGRSRSLRQQSAILHFEITSPPASLDVGTPVTVHVQSGAEIMGLVLPKAAVVRSQNGEDIVWRHTEPERFLATPVKVAPFDGARVLVQAGLTSGQRIVVESADLINQVR